VFINYITLSNDTTASYRYRISIPGNQLMNCRGHIVKVTNNVLPGADVAIFSKHFDLLDPAKALNAKKIGTKVVYDVCDLHVSENLIEHYKKMISIADIVTVPTDGMAEMIKKHFERDDAVVIPEPYEYEEVEAEFAPENPKCLNLLWYGHATNLKALFDSWGDIQGHRILILTNPEALYDINVKAQMWTPQLMLKSLHKCDIVLVPVEDKENKQIKSANRMIEAIRRGRFVVASDTPEHRKFKDFMWIGNIKEGIEWAVSHKDEVVDRIEKAQEYVIRNHSPQKVSMQWEEVFA